MNKFIDNSLPVSLDRLDAYTKGLFASVMIGNRRLVAFTGSGLSSSYGAPSWTEVTQILLGETILELVEFSEAKVQQSNCTPSVLERIEHQIVALKEISKRISEENLKEMAVAQDFVQDALNDLDVARNGSKSGVARLHEMLAGLFDQRGIATLWWIVRQLFPGEKEWHILAERKKDLHKRLIAKDGQTVKGFMYEIFSHKNFLNLTDRVQYFKTFGIEFGDLCESAESSTSNSKLAVFATLSGLLDDKRKNILIDKAFEQGGANSLARPDPDPIAILFEKLQIQRYLTLNYDSELEKYIEDELWKFDGLSNVDQTAPRRELGNGRRRSGKLAVSQAYQPSELAQLYEFALASPQVSSHIVHLHGSAQVSKRLVTTALDYNDQYRKTENKSRDLERALDVVLNSNPILFVGVGLGEPEIMRALQMQIANRAGAASNPVFAIMPPRSKHEAPDWIDNTAHLKKNGVFVLRYGLKDIGDPSGAFLCVRDVIDGLRTIDKEFPKRKSLKARSGDVRSEVDSTLVGVEKLIGISEKTLIQSLIGSDATKKKLVEPVFKLLMSNLKGRIYSAAITAELGLLADKVKEIASWTNQRIVGREQLITKDTNYDRIVPYKREHHFRSVPINGLNLFTSDVKSVFEISLKEPRSVTQSSSEQKIRVEAMSQASACTAMKEKLDQKSGLRALFLIGQQGSGKATVLRALANELQLFKRGNPNPHLFANLSFTLEVESVIDQIQRFLIEIMRSPNVCPKVDADRLEQIRRICSTRSKLKRNAYLVILGIERLIDRNGAFLSADLRLMISLLLNRSFSGLNLIIAMTPMAWSAIEELDRSYSNAGYMQSSGQSSGEITRIGVHNLVDLNKRGELAIPDRLKEFISEPDPEHSNAIADGLSSARLFSAVSRVSDPDGSLSVTNSHHSSNEIVEFGALYAVQTYRWLVKGRAKVTVVASIDHAILRFLAMVSAPVEVFVASRDPEIRRLIGYKPPDPRNLEILVEHFQKLEKLRIITEVSITYQRAPGEKPSLQKNDSRPDLKRYAIHRVLARIIRDELGVSLGDASLSNTFSLTLASSLPSDMIVPATDIRHDLLKLFGYLANAWKDAPQKNMLAFTSNQVALKEINAFRTRLISTSKETLWLSYSNVETLQTLRQAARTLSATSEELGPCIRAAANILRSFFSAASLITVQPPKPSENPQDIADLESHKLMIQQLLSRVRRVSDWRHEVKKVNVGLDQIKYRLRATRKYFEKLTPAPPNPGSFARTEFNILPPLYGGEIVWLHNERAVISLIQGDLYEADLSFKQALEANRYYRGELRGNNLNRIHANLGLLLIERGRLHDADRLLRDLIVDLESRPLAEASILKPLAFSYLGLSAQLSGRLNEAIELYELSEDGFVETRQMRALALLHLRRAALFSNMSDEAKVVREIDAAIHAAGAASQLDVFWRAQIAKIRLRTSAISQSADFETIRKAHEYSLKANLYRVSVEAYMTGSDVAVRIGNLELAADLTAKAMTYANRYGMTLRKIALRVSMGKIMLLRKNDDGEKLIVNAIAYADSIGYESVVNPARQVLIEFGK
jgi:SIR2-like domain